MDPAIPPHRFMSMLVATAAMLLLAPHAARAQTAAADSSRSAADGAYSAAQAAGGETAFRSICGSCHSVSQFSGPSFVKIWTGRRVYDLFDQLRNTMPLDNPGGLSREEYAAVVAYLLKVNQYPAGTSPLPTSDNELKRIRF